MKKILITGVNGYIGKCLYHFLKGKFKVIGIDKDTTFNNKIYKCDILNIKKFDQILAKEKPEVVVHLAAQSLVDETINKEKMYNIKKSLPSYIFWLSWSIITGGIIIIGPILATIALLQCL